MSYSRSAEYSTLEQLIAHTAKAVSHPARLRILALLTKESLTLRQLAYDQPLPRTPVMKHINSLISHNLVTVVSPEIPAVYATNKEQWPPFIAHAVRLAYRFNYSNAA